MSRFLDHDGNKKRLRNLDVKQHSGLRQDLVICLGNGAWKLYSTTIRVAFSTLAKRQLPRE